MRIILLLLFCALTISCNNNHKCSDVKPSSKYSGEGVILFFRSSQDGMADMWFFPVCNLNSGVSEPIVNNNFYSGVSFKLSLLSAQFKKISSRFKQENLDDSSFNNKVWFVPVRIEMQIKENISTDDYNNELSSFTLVSGNKKVRLQYFVSSNISNLDIQPK